MCYYPRLGIRTCACISISSGDIKVHASLMQVGTIVSLIINVVTETYIGICCPRDGFCQPTNVLLDSSTIQWWQIENQQSPVYDMK